MTHEAAELAVRDLAVTFRRTESWERVARIEALRGLSLSVYRGEIIAVVGSSGSGKSVLSHALLGILPNNAEVTGSILYRGEELTRQRLAELRGRHIALVPQSVTFLDPLLRVKHAVRWAARRGGLGKAEASVAQQEAFTRMSLTSETAELFPFQLSGGMARRVLLAMATVGRANVLIADEPTPGLHPEAVHESMSHFRRLADEGRAILIISHDIKACLPVANRIAVFLEGRVIEIAEASAFSGSGEALAHPYSRALWNALPDNSFTATPDEYSAGIVSDELANELLKPHKHSALMDG
jgi:peptide/nickel transport system ATP-binding protein